MPSSPWRFVGLVLADVAVLIRMRPDMPGLLHRLAAPHAWVTDVGADAAATTLCGALLWCVAAWLAVGLLALAAAQLPGAAGRLAWAASRALLPRAVYRLAAGATGLGVLLAPVAAGAQPGAAPTPAPSPTAAATLPAPSWPASNAPASNAPASDTPAGNAPASNAPANNAPANNAPAGGDAPQTDGTQPDAAHVTVQAGDSLWRIAATHLGADATSAQIAEAWPRWYAANRAVIGADPALIRPGQVLSAPTEEGTAR
jgi:nucleoid-associated protein YgaU